MSSEKLGVGVGWAGSQAGRAGSVPNLRWEVPIGRLPYPGVGRAGANCASF